MHSSDRQRVQQEHKEATFFSSGYSREQHSIEKHGDHRLQQLVWGRNLNEGGTTTFLGWVVHLDGFPKESQSCSELWAWGQSGVSWAQMCPAWWIFWAGGQVAWGNHQAEMYPAVRETVLLGVIQWHKQTNSPFLSFSKRKKINSLLALRSQMAKKNSGWGRLELCLCSGQKKKPFPCPWNTFKQQMWSSGDGKRKRCGQWLRSEKEQPCWDSPTKNRS